MKLADVKLNCPFVHRSFRERYQKIMKCSISNLGLVFNLQFHIFQSKVLDKQANPGNMIKTLTLFFTPPDNSYKTFASHEEFRWKRVKTSKVNHSTNDFLSWHKTWGWFSQLTLLRLQPNPDCDSTTHKWKTNRVDRNWSVTKYYPCAR